MFYHDHLPRTARRACWLLHFLVCQGPNSQDTKTCFNHPILEPQFLRQSRHGSRQANKCDDISCDWWMKSTLSARNGGREVDWGSGKQTATSLTTASVQVMSNFILQIIKIFLYWHRNIIAYSPGLPFLFYIRPQIHSYFIFVRKSTLVLYSSEFFSHFILTKIFYTTNYQKNVIIVRTILFQYNCADFTLHQVLV